MLCREEGVWIYPTLLPLLACCVIVIWFKKMDRAWLRSIIIFSSVVIWYIPIFIVSYLNYSYYGFWGYSENLDPDFNRVINTIGRIKTSTSSLYPYNAITKESLAKAYSASPLLVKLKTPFKTNWGFWQSVSDYAMTGMPSWYHEKYGASSMNSMIMFLFRDVLENAGYYSHGKYPHDYLRKLADQLEAACNNGALDCSPGTNIPYAGSLNAEQIPIVLHFFGENIYQLLQLNVVPIASLDIKNWPVTNLAAAKYFEEFIYNPIEPQYFGDAQNSDQLVDKKIDISLKMLDTKETVMKGIQSVYSVITLPGFVILCSGWLVLLIYNLLRRKQNNFSFPAPLIFVFLLGLLISRIMMLALISANSNVYMIAYSDTCYVFLYLIFFMMIYYLVDQTTHLIFLNRKKDLKLISLES